MNSKNGVILFIIFFIIEFFSFLGYTAPAAENLLFFLLLLVIIIVSLYDLKWGLWIAYSELFIGGFGYLFVFKNYGLNLSIRHAFFLIILAITLYKIIKEKRIIFCQSRFFLLYFFLGVTLLLSLCLGYLRGLGPSYIFFDFNGFIFFLYLFSVYQVFTVQNFKKDFLLIFTVATFWLAVKTILVYSLFISNFTGLGSPFYKWIRDSGVGEITLLNGSLYRIFFQSQIYIIFGLFLIIIKQLLFDKTLSFSVKIFTWFLGTILTTAIILSLSRSFWLGTVYTSGILISSIILISLITFIFNPQHQLFLFWSASSNRTLSIADPASQTRLLEIKPLIKGIGEHLIFGSGFGKTLTFYSLDPRILASNPMGLIKTYAFEWGWLDILLKIGLFGSFVYGFLLFKMVRLGLHNWKKDSLNLGENSYLNIMFTLSLITLIVINFFTPYLNHPLGLGWLILSGLFLEKTIPS